ncbi:MAG: DUF6516 family protein [Candidatus Berkelbacteria bacterium]|nr:DUF6516 family protein [Candidatus Berkelbacteria bacterium]
MSSQKDFGKDGLLALNGDRYFIDDKGDLEAIFKITNAAVSLARPHGLRYSLVLINSKGDRVVCFDNAHAFSRGSGSGKKSSKGYDHKHVGNKVTPYIYKDAYTLVADFWAEVDGLVK